MITPACGEMVRPPPADGGAVNSRQLVSGAIHFNAPGRLPFTGSMAETDFSGDTVAVFPDCGLKWWLGGGGVDEWGSRWESRPGCRDMGQVRGAALAKIDDFKSLAVPDASDDARYRSWPEILARAQREGKYVVCCNGPFLFERAHFLLGFEQALVEIVSRPELVRPFLEHIARYHLETIRYIREHFPGLVHGYRGTDDWGTQSAAIIPPVSFRKTFAPVYGRIFECARGAGLDSWLHSCGMVAEIIPPLLGVGLEVINIMQPSVFPPGKLGSFRGRICFEMSVDAQKTLPEGDPASLSAEIARLLDECCDRNGGYIEARLDRMYFEGEGGDPGIAAFCHREYRRLDPFTRRRPGASDC